MYTESHLWAGTLWKTGVHIRGDRPSLAPSLVCCSSPKPGLADILKAIVSRVVKSRFSTRAFQPREADGHATWHYLISTDLNRHPSPPATLVPHCLPHQLLPLIAPAPPFGGLLFLNISLKTKIRATKLYWWKHRMENSHGWWSGREPEMHGWRGSSLLKPALVLAGTETYTTE